MSGLPDIAATGMFTSASGQRPTGPEDTRSRLPPGPALSSQQVLRASLLCHLRTLLPALRSPPWGSSGALAGLSGSSSERKQLTSGVRIAHPGGHRSRLLPHLEDPPAWQGLDPAFRQNNRSRYHGECLPEATSAFPAFFLSTFLELPAFPTSPC